MPYNVPIEKRLWPKVVKHEGGCWEWTGRLNAGGYGEIKWRGRPYMVHRAVYELLVGPIPEGLTLDHTCHKREECAGGNECPHRRCVNPAHLEPIPLRENVLRGNSLSGLNAAKTHCHLGHELAGENLYVTPSGARACRTCARATAKERRKGEKFRKRRAAYERKRRAEARTKRGHGAAIRAAVKRFDAEHGTGATA